MTAAWDRAEALRVARRLEVKGRPVGCGEGYTYIPDQLPVAERLAAAALLRAAAAEIARLRAEAEKG